MFTFNTPTDLKYINAENTLISMSVQFSEFNEILTFIASNTDTEQHGRELFTRAVAGEFGPIAAYVAPIVTTPPTQPDIASQIAAIEAQLAALKAQLP